MAHPSYLPTCLPTSASESRPAIDDDDDVGGADDDDDDDDDR